MNWPNDERTALDAYYCRHDRRPDGQPTAAWEKANLVYIRPPFRMVAAWAPAQDITRVRCHAKVAESLSRVFAAIARLPLDVMRPAQYFGGCYNYRRARGMLRLSTHAWGAAVDLDPVNNELGKPYAENDGMMPLQIIQAFDEEGWEWGGKWQRPDCMHFQAARTR